MKRTSILTLIFLLFGILSAQLAYAQCVELGTNVNQLSPLLKSVVGGTCPTPASSTGNCDCPTGFVAVGYEGFEGNSYGSMVISQFSLRCRELNSDGTLGSTVTVTCANGNVAGNTPDGPVDAAAGEAIVGFELRIGCAIDAVMGNSKPITEIAAGLPNSSSNTMAGIGGTGGSPQPIQFAPNGNVIVGMETFIDPGNNLSAGVAWRYAPINSVACPCSISAISVGNISACNDQGTPELSDDTFTADVTVTYMDPPASGSLDLSGDGTASVDVSGIGSTSHIFNGVSFSADGTAIDLTASFSADPTCLLNNNNAGTAPAACSVASVCSISDITLSNRSACDNNGTTNLSSDDFFTGDVTVQFSNPPSSGTLNLGGDGSASVNVGSLSGSSSHTFSGVSFSADGQAISLNASFSAESSCSLSKPTVGVAPNSCSLIPPSGNIPTMSEWGLILFALVIFTLSVVFGTQQQQRLAAASSNASAPIRRSPSFNKARFLRILPRVYLGFMALFTLAIVFFGYELTNADIPGSLLSGLMIAYLIQFVTNPSEAK